MVRDGREKRVFGECKRITEAGTAKDSTFEVGGHATYIVDLACAISNNTGERMLLIVPNNFPKIGNPKISNSVTAVVALFITCELNAPAHEIKAKTIIMKIKDKTTTNGQTTCFSPLTAAGT